MAVYFGWDLGGANLKLARIEQGRVMSVGQIPCPRRPDPKKFDLAMADAAREFDVSDGSHAVTMTGELSDVFASRAEGVSYLLALMAKTIGKETRVYSLKGFVDMPHAHESWRDVASANWHASAGLAAAKVGTGLLIDVGTTTTDIIPFKNGTVAAVGHDDGERLTEGELIYGGVVRTPVMAVVRQAPFKGRFQGIAAERFATMADVYRLTGELPSDADPYPAADWRGKSPEESATRLARMLGRDSDEAEFIAWKALAHFIARRQTEQIEAGARVLIERDGFGEDVPIVGAGCGRFLVETVAARLTRPYRDFADIVPCDEAAREMVARCAPATAVALLA